MGSKARYSKYLWNHFDNRGPKTNNHVEGFNSKLINFLITHPNIWKFIIKIKSEESNCSLRFIHHKSGSLKERGRRSSDLEKDLKILDLITQFITKNIDLLEFVTALTDFTHDYSK